MKHSEILPRLAAYHDGQLGADERLEIQGHMEQCSECQHLISDWQALDSALTKLPAPQVPVELYGRTREALAEVQSKAGRPRRVNVRFWMAAAAVFVVAFAGTLWWQARAPKMEMAVSPAPTEQPKPESAAPMEAEVKTPAVEESSRANDDYAAPSAGALSKPGAPSSQSMALSSPDSRNDELDASSTASGLVRTGDTGIPQLSDWPARLTNEEFSSLIALRSKLRFRLPQYSAPLEMAEINLLPYFDDAFVAVGYKSLSDPLNPGHEAAYSDPVLLTPETAYLVSNLRLESASIWARSQEQVPTAETAIKLAEITWRLANLTADKDDVKGAIAAHNLAVQQQPDWAAKVSSRLSTLKALDKP